MSKLWIGFAVVIAYGSTYPFNFQMQELDATVIQTFLASCCQRPGLGDVLGNVVLFLPFGYLGVIASNGQSSLSNRVWVVFVSGSALAFALQIAQIYLPSRDENLQDVGWNVIGTLGGALLGAFSWRFVLRPASRSNHLTLIPYLLVGSWLIYRLIPFVPSIDFQAIKKSVKPLFLTPRVEPIQIFHDMVAWLIVASLLQRARRGENFDAYLPILIVAVFGLEVLIVNNVVTLPNVAGAILALVLWWGVFRRVRWQAASLALLICALVIIKGLAPFTLNPQPMSFSWLPFHGLLSGSMYVNVQAICEKVFLYGSLVYLLWQTRLGQMVSTLVAITVVALVEFAQTYVPNHTPEITDPLLLVLAAFTMLVMPNQQDPLVQSETLRGSIRQRRALPPGPNAAVSPAGSVTRTINLRRSQAKFLEDLSQRMGVSVSGVVQKIVDQVIQEKQQTASDSLSIPIRSRPETPSDRGAVLGSDPGTLGDRWVREAVHFRQGQVALLEALSRKEGVSVSNVTRGMIERFMRQL